MVEKLLVSPNGVMEVIIIPNQELGGYGNMFDTTMPQILCGYFQIRDLSDGKVGLSMEQNSSCAASLKISDCYGPIPYSQITGTAFTVEYMTIWRIFINTCLMIWMKRFPLLK